MTVFGAEDLIKYLEDIHDVKRHDMFMKILALKTAKLARLYAAVMTGEMESRIRVIKIADGQYEVVCDVPQAIYNEFGTYFMPIGSESSPLEITSMSGKRSYRPFLRPSAYQTLKDLPDIVKKAIFEKEEIIESEI
jgi:hypothetical protein